MNRGMAWKWATTLALTCFACAEGNDRPATPFDAASTSDGARGGGPDASHASPDARIDPPPPDAAPPAPDPAQPGPFAAGVRTVMMTDPSRSRTFAVDIWYPVDPASA